MFVFPQMLDQNAFSALLCGCMGVSQMIGYQFLQQEPKHMSAAG